jgi:hypothetical protein
MNNPIIKIDDGAMWGYETRKTDWVPIPPGCELLQLLVRLKSAPESSAFSAWLESAEEPTSASVMDLALRPSAGVFAQACIALRKPHDSLIRGCVESRGDPRDLLHFSLAVYPGGSAQEKGGQRG